MYKCLRYSSAKALSVLVALCKYDIIKLIIVCAVSTGQGSKYVSQ